MADRIWITWENQRRSRELADYFGCKIFAFTQAGPLRYPKCMLRTLSTLRKERPATVFVQNPSMVLASLVVFWSFFTKATVVVDRHTTFLLNYKGRPSLRLAAFRIMHWFTLRYAGITIVTNEHLAKIVRDYRGRAMVLPDRLPTLKSCESASFPLDAEKTNILFIASFAEDEPIGAVVEAMRHIGGPDHVHLYVSGRIRQEFAELVARTPVNVTFTDYLPEDVFVSLLLRVDIVLALTTSDATMLCGCYEAVSAEKPLITSDKDVLRDYFTAAVFADATVDGIAHAIDTAVGELESRRELMRVLKLRIAAEWAVQAAEVNRALLFGLHV